MKNLPHKPDQQERELAWQFAVMRREDRDALPPLPEEQELLQRTSLKSGIRSPVWIRQIAAVLVLAVTAGYWITRERTADPADLYVSIIGANAIATDSLLLVSQGILPETSHPPGLYEVAVPEDWSQVEQLDEPHLRRSP